MISLIISLINVPCRHFSSFWGLKNQSDFFKCAISQSPDVGIWFVFFLNNGIFDGACEYSTLGVLRVLRKKP